MTARTFYIIILGGVIAAFCAAFLLSHTVIFSGRDDGAGGVPTPKAVAAQTIPWGAYVGGAAGDAATFESLVGHPMNMQAIFAGWSSETSFPSQYASTVGGAGKTLVVFWEPSDGSGSLSEPSYNYDSISGGSWDSYISSFAAGAKSYGGPVILVPFEEMNGNWDPWDGTVNGNTPAKFIAAWHHIHDLFGAAGASNVKFGWDVNNTSVPDDPGNAITAYYPGDAYVDYVGVDGFNFGNPWQSWSDVFSSALGTLETYNKPIYIFSMASAEGSDKPAWITDALTTEIPKYPIAGWVWFNINKEQDWRVNSSPASLAAFQNALQ